MNKSPFHRVRLNSFSLSPAGLTIRYSTINTHTIVEFDIISTCEELQHFAFIQGYVKDTKFPPKIIITDDYQTKYWGPFVKSFELTNSMVQQIAERHFARKAVQNHYHN